MHNGIMLAQVGGSVDAVFELGAQGEKRAAVIQQAVAKATQAAVAAGAVAASCEVVQCDTVPLAYLPGGAARVTVKVVGNIRLHNTGLGDTDVTSAHQQTSFPDSTPSAGDSVAAAGGAAAIQSHASAPSNSNAGAGSTPDLSSTEPANSSEDVVPAPTLSFAATSEDMPVTTWSMDALEHHTPYINETVSDHYDVEPMLHP